MLTPPAGGRLPPTQALFADEEDVIFLRGSSDPDEIGDDEMSPRVISTAATGPGEAPSSTTLVIAASSFDALVQSLEATKFSPTAPGMIVVYVPHQLSPLEAISPGDVGPPLSPEWARLVSECVALGPNLAESGRIGPMGLVFSRQAQC